jgi:hypothetical protein
MKRLAGFCFVAVFAASLAFAVPKAAKNQKTFVGEIGDSMCGLKHMMGGNAKDCTLECVKAGSKFILADTAAGQVYDLSDQAKARDFAGHKVKVTGTLKGKTIEVASIEAAD